MLGESFLQLVASVDTRAGSRARPVVIDSGRGRRLLDERRERERLGQ